MVAHQSREVRETTAFVHDTPMKGPYVRSPATVAVPTLIEEVGRRRACRQRPRAGPQMSGQSLVQMPQRLLVTNCPFFSLIRTGPDGFPFVMIESRSPLSSLDTW